MREIKFRAWNKKEKRIMNWIDSIIWNSAGIDSVKQTTPLQGFPSFWQAVKRRGGENCQGEIFRRPLSPQFPPRLLRYFSPTHGWMNSNIVPRYHHEGSQ